MPAPSPEELAKLTTAVPRERQLQAVLYELLSRMDIRYRPESDQYAVTLPEPIVLTAQAHGVIMGLLEETAAEL